MECKWYSLHEFLAIYRKYDILWNIKRSDYSNKNVRDVSFQKLVSEVKETGLDVTITTELLRKRIKTIRTVYRQELAKILKSEKNGAATDEISVLA